MPKRKRNSINTPFARTIIFSGVILLLVAFLLMRLETVSTWIGTILSTLRPVIIGAVITLVLHTPVRRLEGFLKNITKGKRFPCSAVAVILSYLLLFSVLAGIVCIIVPQFSQSLVDFADQFTIYFINFQKFLQTYSSKGEHLYDLMQQVGLDFAQLKSWLTDLSVTVSSYSCYPDIFGDVSYTPVAHGVVQTTARLAMLIGSTLVGYLIQFLGYTGTIYVIAPLSLVAALCWFFAKKVK